MAIWIGHIGSLVIRIRLFKSNSPLGVVMDEGRDILVKLERLGGSVESRGGGREGKRGGIGSRRY